MTYPVDDGQLALYLTFTFLSLVASLIVYCFYHHAFHLSDKDYSNTIATFAKISQIREEKRHSSFIERPLI